MWGKLRGTYENKTYYLFFINYFIYIVGGEGGIRTHVPGLPDHLISSQRRYGHFGTSPD
jgi:hypothetical protein